MEEQQHLGGPAPDPAHLGEPVHHLLVAQLVHVLELEAPRGDPLREVADARELAPREAGRAERLARERTFLETLFNTIEDGVLVVDEKKRIIYLNSAISNLLGIQSSAEGHAVTRYLPELDWDQLMNIDAQGAPVEAAGLASELDMEAHIEALARACMRTLAEEWEDIKLSCCKVRAVV